jgi:hypothetical protein
VSSLDWHAIRMACADRPGYDRSVSASGGTATARRSVDGGQKEVAG